MLIQYTEKNSALLAKKYKTTAMQNTTANTNLIQK